MRSRENALLPAAVLTVAAAIRLFVDNVTNFSPADETIYLRYTQVLVSGGGYARIVRDFISEQWMWVFPNPLRWGYLGATTLLCKLTGDCTYRDLAMLSTIAGIAAVALTYVLGLQLFDRKIALFAAALMATSPLQLAMGRRALSDEFFCAVVLASLVAMVAVARPSPGPSGHPLPLRGRGALVMVWVMITTLAFAAKEQFLFIYPFVLLFWWMRERKIRWILWALPPALFFAVFCLLARDVTAFFRIAQCINSVMHAPYAVQYQNGALHRVIIDFLIVAPLVTMAFIAAGWMKRREPLVLLAIGILIVHSLISSKNLRYTIPADPLIRLVVASAFPRKSFLVINAIVELVLFHIVFIANDVYDPVTYELLRALRMVPL